MKLLHGEEWNLWANTIWRKSDFACYYVWDLCSYVCFQVETFFTRLIQRVAPKSYAQALGEVTVTQKFLENFSGDQVWLMWQQMYNFYHSCSAKTNLLKYETWVLDRAGNVFCQWLQWKFFRIKNMHELSVWKKIEFFFQADWAESLLALEAEGGFGFMVFLIVISLGSLWAGSFPGEIFCCSWEPCRAAKHWPSLAIWSGSYTSSYSCVVSSGCASLNERCSFSLNPNSSAWPPVLIWSAEGPCFCIWWSGPGCNNHTIQFSIGDSSVTGSWCSLHGQQAPLESWQ